MVGRRILGLFLLVALLTAVGCSQPTLAPVPSPEETAVDVLTAYLEARRSGAMAEAYAQLSDQARAALTQQEMAEYYQGVRSFTWGSLGEPKWMDPDWMRIIVFDIEAMMADGRLIREPEHAYYLNRSGDRWGVALANPLIGRVGQLYGQNATAQEIYDVIGQMLTINPWSYRAHVEMLFLFMNTGDAAAAAGAIQNLHQVALPADLPELHALHGEYEWELIGNPEEARRSFGLALEMAAVYPERYGDAWRSQYLTLLGQVHRALEEDAAAQEAALEAHRLDSTNESAKALLTFYGIAAP